MKICFIMKYHWSFSFGGAEIQVKFLIDKLLDLSHEVFFICEQSIVDTYRGCIIITLNTNKFLLKFGCSVASLKIINLLKAINPEVIYIRADTGYLFPAVMFNSISKNTRVILHIANIQNVERFKLTSIKQLFVSFLDRLLYRISLHRASLLICQAHYQGEMLKKNFNISNFIIIPNYQNIPANINQSKNKDKIVVSWISNLKRNKHPEIFVALAKRFYQDVNIEFYMIGRSNIVWKSLINKLNNLQNCKYLGQYSFEQVNAFLKNTDILVSTGIKEGFPNIMIQSWMLSIPVLSYCFDPDGLIKSFNLGLVSSNLEKLEKDLRTLISDINLRKKLGENARSYAVKHFSMKNLDLLVNAVTIANPMH